MVSLVKSSPRSACISPIRHKEQDLTFGSASDDFVFSVFCKVYEYTEIVALLERFLRKYFSIIFIALTFKSGCFSSIASL